MKKIFLKRGAEISFTWDSWVCQGNYERQYIACTGHALTDTFEMLRACLFVKRIKGIVARTHILIPCGRFRPANNQRFRAPSSGISVLCTQFSYLVTANFSFFRYILNCIAGTCVLSCSNSISIRIRFAFDNFWLDSIRIRFDKKTPFEFHL